MIKNFMTTPSGGTMLKKHLTSNTHGAENTVGENMQFWGYFINKIFIKICSHPIINFFVIPAISHEKIL